MPQCLRKLQGLGDLWVRNQTRTKVILEEPKYTFLISLSISRFFAGNAILLLVLCIQHSFPDFSTVYLVLILATLVLELICFLAWLLPYAGENYRWLKALPCFPSSQFDRESITLATSKFSCLAENLFSTCIFHCWPDLSNFKPSGK
jgi:hypothetical protein